MGLKSCVDCRYYERVLSKLSHGEMIMLRKKITLIAVGLLFSMSSYAANSGQITFKGRIVDDRCIQTNVDELISNKVTRNACFNDIQKVSV